MTKPKSSSVLVRVIGPTREELRQAAAARRELGGRTCGCFTQLLRNPFYSGLVGHYRTYHPHLLPNLAHSQQWRLERIAEMLTGRLTEAWPAEPEGEHLDT